MKDGFIRVGAANFDVVVADCESNKEKIMTAIDEAVKAHIKVLTLPELCITGYTCGDLFLQTPLLEGAKEALLEIVAYTEDKDILVAVGLPLEVNQSLYNVAAVICGGNILGFVPKQFIPNYSEFYEARHFTRGNGAADFITFNEEEVPFGSHILFQCRQFPKLMIGVEICEDLWVPAPPSNQHALAGATMILNLSASDEVTDKAVYRRQLVSNQSGRLVCAYVYASAGEGESSTDLVFGGHSMIAENGSILKESKRFENQMIYTDVDMEKLVVERRRMNTFETKTSHDYLVTEFNLDPEDFQLMRRYQATPFVPTDKAYREKRCEEILSIQAMGLKKRLAHTHCKCAVVGISGGLDSTLALLVAVRAFDMLGMDRKQMVAVTMPCFGTTDRTYNNACQLVKRLGCTLKEVDIKEAVTIHFRDIGQDMETHDVTYENGQARERTQVIMDIANKMGGMVIGTGDLSELALGWATYNGDHMSMYGVNASVPKTLVRYLVHYCADITEDTQLKETLLDILDTPVSPELIPPKDGEISQKTEDLVGPYELHDFYLYHMMRFGYMPSKIYRLAKNAFEGQYDDETILKWLKTFYRRFFMQQFKRSCLPDGPKVGSVALSPRGDFRMPSDASAYLWQRDLENL